RRRRMKLLLGMCGILNDKSMIFAVLGVVFLTLAINSGAAAVDTREIDTCCHKDVLNDGDLQIIDDFVADAVDELVKTKDFTSIAKIRTVILSRSNSSKDSAKAQYGEQFSESAHKYISKALEAAKELTPAEHQFRVILNLLILVDSLQDLRLSDLAMKWLDDEDNAIRYWAVHSITNPGIIERLNSKEAANLELAERITKELRKVVESSDPETLALMAEFAAKVDIPEGEELLLQIADMRIKRYENWTVEYELLDGDILRLLDSRIPAGSVSKPEVSRRFGQLYSYAIQRYIKGRDVLSDAQKNQLASVLVETEMSIISKRSKVSQSVVKNAVEQNDYTALLQEHSRLLGDETRAGQLPLKLNFDYGKNADGSRRIAPLALPEPPKELIPSTKLRTSTDN
ncbi:MAG: hypothetical protein MUP16_01350, partial [Sedimentisphaerales bacterium]|nr:hypothetical protein [Sedimentisphaerales bacterium]